MKRILSALLICFSLFACDDDNKSNNNNTNNNNLCETACESWQVCDEHLRICVTADGFCANYSQCDDNMFCDEDHICRGPTEPPNEFFNEKDGNWATFSFLGRIMSEEEAAGPSPTWGSGSATVSINNESINISSYPYSIERLIPEDSEIIDLRGKTAITAAMTKQNGYVDQFIDVDLFYFAIDQEILREMKEANEVENDLSEGWIVFYDKLSVFIRSWDNGDFRRMCHKALKKPDGVSSIFLNYFDNEDFSSPEDLMIWGNFSLGEIIEITEANEEQYCTYRLNGSFISKNEFYQGIALAKPEFSCEIPADFLDNSSENYVSFQINGMINNVEIPFEQNTLAWSDAVSVVNGTVVESSDFYSIIYYYDGPRAPDSLLIQFLGDVDQTNPDYDHANFLEIIVPRQTLIDAHDASQTLLSFDDQVLSLSLEEFFIKTSNNVEYYKICPIAAGVTTADSIINCNAQNTAFAIGENLEFTGNISLSTDPSLFAPGVTLENGCYCMNSSDSSIIQCSEWEDL